MLLFYLKLLWRILNKRPYKLTVFITDGCNYKCSMCSIWENEIYYLKNDDFNKILSRLDYSPLWINLSGGETFLNPELGAMLQSIARIFPKAIISLTSNGSFPERLTLVDQVPNPIILLLSLDGDESMHAQIRGQQAAYGNILKCLKKIDQLKLRKKNITKTMAVTLSEKNLNHTFDFLNDQEFSDCSININVAQKSDYYQGKESLLFNSVAEKLDRIFKMTMRLDLNSFFLYAYIKKMRSGISQLPCSSVWAYTMVDSKLNVKNCTLRYQNIGTLNGQDDLQKMRGKALNQMQRDECYKNCESICERFTHITTSYLNPFKLFMDFVGFGIIFLKWKIRSKR